jgi:hypothetical protein
LNHTLKFSWEQQILIRWIPMNCSTFY